MNNKKIIVLINSKAYALNAGVNSTDSGSTDSNDTHPLLQPTMHAASYDSPCTETYNSSDVSLLAIPDNTWHDFRLPGLDGVKTCAHYLAHECRISVQDPLNAEDNF